MAPTVSRAVSSIYIGIPSIIAFDLSPVVSSFRRKVLVYLREVLAEMVSFYKTYPEHLWLFCSYSTSSWCI